MWLAEPQGIKPKIITSIKLIEMNNITFKKTDKHMNDFWG